jgi:hypothetical protein
MKHPVDSATLALSQKLDRANADHPFVGRYRKQLTSVNAMDKSLLENQVFVLAPGWLYKSEAHTGADLSRQRYFLESLGARVHFVELDENGTVENNALQLQKELTILASQCPSLIITSASKGGIEVACALSSMHGSSEITAIKAWINFGGLLRGTPLADLSLTWWMRWLTWSYVVPDWSLAALRSMTISVSAARFAALRRPSHIKIINVIGMPLSDSLSELGKWGYWLLKKYGPNDGVTLLEDALYPNAATITYLGADHFFQIPDLDQHCESILHSVLTCLQDEDGKNAPTTAT